MGCMVAYYTPVQILKIRLCSPISKNWDTDGTQRGSCLNQQNIFIADTVMSSVIDLAILLIPMPIIGSLQMPFRKKLRIFALLAAGGVATMATIARLIMVVQIGGLPDSTVTGTQFYLLG